MTQYYFVSTSLPALTLGEKPEISWDQLEELLINNLTNSDYVKTQVLRRYFDLLNIRAFLKGEALDPFGNLDKNQIEEMLVGDGVPLPHYIKDYFERYETKGDRLLYFPKLIATFFQEEVIINKGFLEEYLEFERKLRLVLTAYRAKQMNRNLLKELQFENPDEEIIVQLLSQKDSKIFEPPEQFEDLKPLLEENYSSPMALHKALNTYRYQKLQEMVGMDLFSLDSILSYLARFFIVEKSMALDKQQGLQIVDNIIKGKS